VTDKVLTVHEELAADLGFRVDASNDKLFYGENPRPSTREENLLWGRAVQAKAAFRASQGKNAQLEADNASLRASCEAYREQLQKLHDFLAHEFPIMPTDDAVEYAMTKLVESYKHVCQPEPQSTMRQMLDARAVADSFGTPANPTIGER
jgi:hypothetical protein